MENNETMVKDKKISKGKIAIFLILFVILVVGVIIGIRYYKIKDYVGSWSGTYVEQGTDGTTGLVPTKFVDIYDVDIGEDGNIKIHKFWSWLEQKKPNSEYTIALSSEDDIYGKLIIRKGKVYFKVEIGDGGAGLKTGDITELEWINYNKINMILPEHEVSLIK